MNSKYKRARSRNQGEVINDSSMFGWKSDGINMNAGSQAIENRVYDTALKNWNINKKKLSLKIHQIQFNSTMDTPIPHLNLNFNNNNLNTFLEETVASQTTINNLTSGMEKVNFYHSQVKPTFLFTTDTRSKSKLNIVSQE
jgi:hypothetical protein